MNEWTVYLEDYSQYTLLLTVYSCKMSCGVICEAKKPQLNLERA